MTSPTLPSHVTADLVRDIDIYALSGLDEGIQQAWSKLQSHGPIIYTPRNGGHWIIIDTDLVFSLFSDVEHLSNTKKAIPAHPGTPMLPSEADPPEHAAYRALVQPVFTPRYIQGIEEAVQRQARLLIDGFYARGHCEFIAEFGQKLPITIFLNLMGLPLEHLPMLSGYAEIVTRHADPVARADAWNAVQSYLREQVHARRAQSGRDLISSFVTSRIGERELTETEIMGICTNLLLGGLDTVASMMGCIAHFLASSKEHCRTLAARPQLIPRAVEELTRRFAVVGQGRVVRKELRVGSAVLREGDRVLLPTMLFNLDARHYPDPWNVDFERKGPANLSFGHGIHRCVGALLARTEIKVFLQEWLARIPEFTLEPGAQPVFKSGQVSAVMHLPLVWEPQLRH